jgi:hypothetical protein
LRGAYARDVDPSEHPASVESDARRRTPIRVPGECDTTEVPTVGADTASLDLPAIVAAAPKTEATPVTQVAHGAVETQKLSATELIEHSEPKAPALRLSRDVLPRRPLRRERVRKVTRVVRHIDPWSAFKVGALFSFAAYVVGLTAGVLLWRVADSTGTLGNVERWFTQFVWETFEMKVDEVFAAARTIGLFLSIALTGLIVLLATLFNLVSDVIGGLRVSVLVEESVGF